MSLICEEMHNRGDYVWSLAFMIFDLFATAMQEKSENYTADTKVKINNRKGGEQLREWESKWDVKHVRLLLILRSVNFWKMKFDLWICAPQTCEPIGTIKRKKERWDWGFFGQGN